MGLSGLAGLVEASSAILGILGPQLDSNDCLDRQHWTKKWVLAGCVELNVK